MEHLLFYYSGTGNSLYDAILMGQRLGNAKLISMRHAENRGINIGQCDTIGFVFPVHHLGMPLGVKIFIEQLQVQKPQYVYAIITSGSWELSCVNELKKILHNKGIELDYFVIHKNVYSNITSMFPAAYNIEQNVRADGELEKHIQHILKRKKIKSVKGNGIKRFHDTVLPELTRMIEDRGLQFDVNDTCNQCGICIEVCGKSNIIMADNKPEHQNDCEKCLSCIQYCPREAINIKDLTEDRKRYHHPFISSSRIAKSQIVIENGTITNKNLVQRIDNE